MPPLLHGQACGAQAWAHAAPPPPPPGWESLHLASVGFCGCTTRPRPAPADPQLAQQAYDLLRQEERLYSWARRRWERTTQELTAVARRAEVVGSVGAPRTQQLRHPLRLAPPAAGARLELPPSCTDAVPAADTAGPPLPLADRAGAGAS